MKIDIKHILLIAALLVLPATAHAEELPEGKAEKAEKFEPKAKKEKTPAEHEADDRYILGYVEAVRIPELGIKLKAKLDTGATTSSIDAEIIDIRKNDEDEPKEVEGQPKKTNHGNVIYTIIDSKGIKKTLERKIIRWARIKSKKEGFIRRPVVEMEFCIAGLLIKEQVNLSERAHFNYPILIGRNMLKEGKIAVDPSKTFSAKPNCKKPKLETEAESEEDDSVVEVDGDDLDDDDDDDEMDD